MTGCLKTVGFILFFPFTIPIWLWQRSWPGKLGALLFIMLFAVAVGTIPTPEERKALDAQATVIANIPTRTPTPVPVATNVISASAPIAMPVVPTETHASATGTPIPTNVSVPTPTPELSEQQRLYLAIEEALGDGNRDYPRVGDVKKVLDVINVRWAINDSFQERESALIDIVDMLKAIQTTGISYYIVNFEGTFPLIDANQNSTEETVIWATFEAAEVNRINWDRFLTKDVLLIASTTKEHPALTE